MKGFDTAKMMQQFREMAKTPGKAARNTGDANAALGTASRKVTAVYEVPYLSHLMMEPLNCTVDLRADSCEVWTGSQFQTVDRANAAKVAGLPNEKVQLHTTFLGGGFGRRANPQSDFVVEAVHVAKVAGAPVKVMWTREDDMNGGWYRPAFLHAIEAGVDANGKPIAWRSRLVGQSIMKGTPFEAMVGLDKLATIRDRLRASMTFLTEFQTFWWKAATPISAFRCSGCVRSDTRIRRSPWNVSLTSWRLPVAKTPIFSGNNFSRTTSAIAPFLIWQLKRPDGVSRCPRAWDEA